ncbi:MAG: hypothetical protein HY545_00255 [Candidatus Doudnabacteria bacterium]|nr:hypothetical protein [Candidatus Doudnabacteria bacterium]
MFTSETTSILIQGLLVAIIIGVFYNFWASSKAYGGIVGRALKLFGAGLLFITISVLEKILINFSVIEQTPNLGLVQDLLNLVGLFLLARGFFILASVAKG